MNWQFGTIICQRCKIPVRFHFQLHRCGSTGNNDKWFVRFAFSKRLIFYGVALRGCRPALETTRSNRGTKIRAIKVNIRKAISLRINQIHAAERVSCLESIINLWRVSGIIDAGRCRAIIPAAVMVINLIGVPPKHTQTTRLNYCYTTR
jgi:hypothetical protein